VSAVAAAEAPLPWAAPDPSSVPAIADWDKAVVDPAAVAWRRDQAMGRSKVLVVEE